MGKNRQNCSVTVPFLTRDKVTLKLYSIYFSMSQQKPLSEYFPLVASGVNSEKMSFHKVLHAVITYNKFVECQEHPIHSRRGGPSEKSIT